MADTWGSTTLSVIGIERGFSGSGPTERRLVRDPDSSDPQSTLMGGGRLRYRRTLQLLISDADYASLETDWVDCTARTLTLTEAESGWSDSMYIADMRGARQVGQGYKRATVEFVEA